MRLTGDRPDGLLPVLDRRPEFVPTKRAVEFAVMTFFAIPGPERPVGKADGGIAFCHAGMQTARPVETHLDERRIESFSK